MEIRNSQTGARDFASLGIILRMKRTAFSPSLQDLPETLPIFPLSGVLLLPDRQLPLNIFEPRYLNMVLDALGAGRLLGMIQPKADPQPIDPPSLYPVGCAGRITAFNETDDGRQRNRRVELINLGSAE